MSLLPRFLISAFLLLPTLGSCSEAVLAINKGDVRLNGAALLRSSAVFGGDELRTSTDSAVILHAKGSTVQVGPSANLRVLDGTEVTLESGTLRVNGMMSVVAGKVRVAPEMPGASYVVTRGAGLITVTVTKGTVAALVSSKSQSIVAGDTECFQEGKITVPAAKKRPRTGFGAALGTATGAGVGAIVASHLKDDSPVEISGGTFVPQVPKHRTNRKSMIESVSARQYR